MNHRLVMILLTYLISKLYQKVNFQYALNKEYNEHCIYNNFHKNYADS